MQYPTPSLLLALAFIIPLLSPSQEVTTLANVTANGGVTLDSEGNIYVAHFGPLPITPGQEGADIYKITPEGEVSIFVDGQLTVGSGNHFDSQGFLYQSNYQINTVFKIDMDGTIVDDGFASIPGPVGVTVIANDTLVVCSCNTNSLIKVAQDGSQSTLASGPVFNCANGIAQDGEGNLYTTNFSDGRITKVTPDGTTSTMGSTPVGNGHIAYRSLEEAFYIASYSGDRIYRMDMSGAVTLFAGTGSPGAIDSDDPLQASFNRPNGIEISWDGCSLYISQDDDVLREILFADLGCTTAIGENADLTDIEVYPNPSQGTVKIADPELKVRSVEIRSLDGRSALLPEPAPSGIIDLKGLPSGTYFLTIRTDKGSNTQKIVLEDGDRD